MSKTAALTSQLSAGRGYHAPHGSWAQRPAAFMRLGSVDLQLEIPSFDEIRRKPPVADTASECGSHELEEFFADIDPNPTSSSRWSACARLRDMVVSLWKSRRRKRESAGALAALSQMDDRMLRDIGVQHRLQLEDLVRFGRDHA